MNTKKRLSPLIAGYQEFRSHYFEGEHSLYEQLSKYGQRPRTLVIACSDSRVDPALVMHSAPGDLFVVRNVANLVPPYEDDEGYHGTSAALEFAVKQLGVEDIIVFGHTQCGGIRALMESPEETKDQRSFIVKWMRLAKPARDLALEKHADLSVEAQSVFCGQYALKNSLVHLRTFPWIKEREDRGALCLHAWYFDLSTGVIHALDEALSAFSDLT